MRISLVLFSFLISFQAYSCTNAMNSFEVECKAQDRYQKLNDDFKKYSISVTNLKGFIIPRAVGELEYYSNKNDFLNHPETTLFKNKYWLTWISGQNFINSLNPITIDLKDVLKLHKTLFANRSSETGSELGKLRTNSGETNPKLALSCDDQILNDKVINLLANYDLTSLESYSLLSLKNTKKCDIENYSSGVLIYYKGASVTMELGRWIAELNDTLARYENDEAESSISPYRYLSDMRRWFLALRPFTYGNEEVVNALIDFSIKRLHLPPLLPSDSANPIFLTAEENRAESLKKLTETLAFFEGCLFETKTQPISPECSPLK